MRRTFTQLIAVVGLALLLGTVYNLVTGAVDSERHLTFFVPENRYQKALECQRPARVPAGAQAISAPTTPTAPAERRVEPAVTREEPSASVPAPEPASTGSLSPPAPAEDGTPRILLEEAHELWSLGLLFIDARRSKEYVKGHIPGALSISPWENDREAKVSALANDPNVNKAEPVVVYCTESIDCEDSEMVAGDLKVAGFADVQIFQGGFPAWEKAKNPVAEGEKPGERPAP